MLANYRGWNARHSARDTVIIARRKYKISALGVRRPGAVLWTVRDI